jgi:uncharacterized membrane protein YdjX (TVP38/TMEM64 family)
VTHAELRRTLVALWVVVAVSALYAFFFHRAAVERQLHDAAAWSGAAAGALYLAFGCLRGFTFIPSTTLVLTALPFIASWPLFWLTLAGILVSSGSIYFFAEALHLEEVLARRHEDRVRRLTAWLQKYELPVIIGWSFFPLVPTDLIVYVCGILRVSVVKCLIGVAIGEGAICAIYIFGGDQALRWLGWR